MTGTRWRRRSGVPLGLLMLLASAGLGAQSAALGRAYAPLRADVVPAALATLIQIDVDSIPLARVLQDIAHRANVGFTYDRRLAGLETKVTLHERRIAASSAIVRLLEGSLLQAMVSRTGHVVIVARRLRTDEIRGLVIATNGEPVGGARVELQGTSLVSVASASGAFTLSQVPRAF